MGTRHVLPTVQAGLKVEVYDRSFVLTDRSAMGAELLPANCIGTPAANLYVKMQTLSANCLTSQT
jgi:DNA-binding transcriptional regulator PaaX